MAYNGTGTVFKFKMWFNRDDFSDYQVRYVVAKSEEEATEKFWAYLDYLKENSFEIPAVYSDYPTVDNYCVII